MVYDCFMFFDELDMLEIRMNILDPVVDFFVITEANTTLMGQPKEMIFEKNRNRFFRFDDKIIYNPVDTLSDVFSNQWEREVYQKNKCIDGLKSASDEDIVIFSDLDEIPNPIRIQEICNMFDEEKIYHFAQDVFYFFINYKNIDGSLLAACGEFPNYKGIDCRWLGTKLCSYKIAKEVGLDKLRHKEMINEDSIRVSDGGWHFSYMGGSNLGVQQRVKNKLSAFSHSNYNKWRYYNYLSICFAIFSGRDLLGRKSRFKKNSIDDSYPEWLRVHYKEYPQFIL